MMQVQDRGRRLADRSVAMRLFKDRRGTIAIKFVLVFPILLLLVGNSLEYARYIRDQSQLQSAADAAALGSAKELSLTDTKSENLQAVAQSIVDALVGSNVTKAMSSAPQVTTEVRDGPTEVEVTITQKFKPVFGGMVGAAWKELRVSAVAQVVGQPNICVLGLNGNESGTISLEKDARVTGQNCAVYSNSTHANGLRAKNSASLEATFICSRGGKDGGKNNFTPEPLVDCPAFDDPLADRPEPFVSNCDPDRPTRIDYDTTLNPGTYCGLEIANGAIVTLRDGVFAIRDKPLVVRDGGSLIGKSVGLFFTGTNAVFTFEPQSTISLEAPSDGAMAGLLVFASRAQSDTLKYSILSNDARVLIGTIYIPKGELHVEATNPIADHSAYTAIVSDKMRLYGGPHLVLNTNYSKTTVPVPDGIKGAGQPVALVR